MFVTESHATACSALAERRYLFREPCLVAVAVTKEAAAATRNTYTHNTHSHTPSLLGRENAQRARVEEGVACTGESRNVERGRESGAERARERERRERESEARKSRRE